MEESRPLRPSAKELAGPACDMLVEIATATPVAIAIEAETAVGRDEHRACAASGKGELPNVRGAMLTPVGVFARHLVDATGRIIPALSAEVTA